MCTTAGVLALILALEPADLDPLRPFAGGRPTPPPSDPAHRNMSEGPLSPGSVDPRGVPEWAERDARLTRWTLGTGVFAGVMTLGLGVTLGLSFSPVAACDLCGPEGNMAVPIAIGTMIGLVGVGLIGFTGVAAARAHHRRPLRRWRAQLAAGGFQLRF